MSRSPRHALIGLILLLSAGHASAQKYDKEQLGALLAKPVVVLVTCLDDGREFGVTMLQLKELLLEIGPPADTVLCVRKNPVLAYEDVDAATALAVNKGFGSILCVLAVPRPYIVGMSSAIYIGELYLPKEGQLRDQEPIMRVTGLNWEELHRKIRSKIK